MDSMRGPDPSSSNFQAQAIRNVAQVGFGGVRTQKDLEPRDQVRLSQPPAQELHLVDPRDLAAAAAMAGELSELADDLVEDDGEVDERRQREREEELEKDAAAQEAVRALESRSVHDLLQDIPASSLGPAQNIVAAQMQGGRPSQSLTQRKPVQGMDAFDFGPAPRMGLLDIHDLQASPVVHDLPEAEG